MNRFAWRCLFLVLILSCGQALGGGYALRVVQPGDTLASIASLYNITVESLMAFNELTSTTIHPGDTLKVPYIEAQGGAAEAAPSPPPGFRLHVLQSGETMSSLAARYNLSIAALVGANPDISSLDHLPAGMELLIPPGEGLVITLEHDQSILDVVQVYGLSPTVIAKANGIDSPGDLQAGKLLFLPGVPALASLDRLTQVRADEAQRLAEENSYIWPVHGRLTSYFGRRNLGRGTSNFHRGLDIGAPHGAQVVAARAGTVTFAGWSSQGYGNLVKITHYGGAESWYAHNSTIAVTVGQYVERGEEIARVGSTGISTGPHVHFEIHENGQAIDPLTYLR